MKTFKKIIQILVIILLFSCFTQAQYAPWAKLSSNAPKDISARKYPVPSKNEVGITPYPGAVISSVSAPREDTVKYDQSVLPFVILVTTDEPDKVISFYKRILTKEKGWAYTEEYKTFVKGQTSKVLTGFLPSVAIRNESGQNFDLVYIDESFKNRLKARIQITYKPIE